MSEPDDRKPVLTAQQEAEGWTVEKQGGMWVKTFDLSKLTLCACFNPDWQVRAEAAEARVRELELALREFEASIDSTRASVEQGRFEVRRLQAAGERLLKIGECATPDEARELAMDEFNRAEAAEAKVARLQARIDRNFVHTSDQLRALLEEP